MRGKFETGTTDIRQDINIVHCSIIHFTKANLVIDNIATSIYCRDYTVRLVPSCITRPFLLIR